MKSLIAMFYLLYLVVLVSCQPASAWPLEPTETRDWRTFGLTEPAWPPLDVPIVWGKTLGAEDCPGCTSGVQAWIMEVAANKQAARFPWVTYGQLTTDQAGGDGTIHNVRGFQNGVNNWMSLFYGELFQRGSENTGIIYGCEAHADGADSNTYFCANFHAKSGNPLAAINVMQDDGAEWQYAMIAGGRPIALDAERRWTLQATSRGLEIRKDGKLKKRWR